MDTKRYVSTIKHVVYVGTGDGSRLAMEATQARGTGFMSNLTTIVVSLFKGSELDKMNIAHATG